MKILKDDASGDSLLTTRPNKRIIPFRLNFQLVVIVSSE